jgi:hypothetical protein
LQGDERREHGSGVILALAGKKRSQRVDDDEVDGAFGVEAGDAFNEIRRNEGRYVAEILVRRIRGVTVLCDESSDVGGTILQGRCAFGEEQVGKKTQARAVLEECGQH